MPQTQKKNYINGVYCHDFGVMDKVRLRTPNEIDELSSLKGKSYCYNFGFNNYKEWLRRIISDDNFLKEGEIYEVIAVRKNQNPHIDTFPFLILLPAKRDPNTIYKRVEAATWIMIEVKEKQKEDLSRYRTTEDGFFTNDDNWLPENRWF